MIVYSLALLAGAIVDAWLLALVAIRGRRPWLQATFAALALTSLVNAAAFVGTSEGLLDSAWEAAVLWTLVLAQPLTAVLVLGLVHGETLPRHRPLVFALLALAPVVVLLTPSADWGVAHAYEPNLLGAYLIVCLGVALAEAAYLRMTSALFAADAFWLAFGVVLLIVGGPIYSLEFQDLGILSAAGSNAAAPVALALFAFVLFHSEPFAAPRPAGGTAWDGAGAPSPGTTIVLDESRPKYALDLAARAAENGAPLLVVARGDAAMNPALPSAVLSPTRSAAARSLGTVAEFFTRSRGGLAVLPDLSEIAMLSGWPRTREAFSRLTGVARSTGGRLIVSTTHLTSEEKQDLRGQDFPFWTLPDPSIEFESVLAPSFGGGAGRLLDAFCRAEGVRRQDLTLRHAEPFLVFLDRAVAELGVSAADASARSGLRSQTGVAAAALRAFASRTPEDLSKGAWPSRSGHGADRDLLVTAADYWKGKEMEELFTTASDLGERESLSERARAVFVEQLGDAGEGMFRSELAKLGRTPTDLRPEDVTRLADRAAVDLAALADVVDVPQEKVRIRGQVESIRRRLAALAGDER